MFIYIWTLIAWHHNNKFAQSIYKENTAAVSVYSWNVTLFIIGIIYLTVTSVLCLSVTNYSNILVGVISYRSRLTSYLLCRYKNYFNARLRLIYYYYTQTIFFRKIYTVLSNRTFWIINNNSLINLSNNEIITLWFKLKTDKHAGIEFRTTNHNRYIPLLQLIGANITILHKTNNLNNLQKLQ